MYVIIAYDVGVERVNKIKSFLRKYFIWIQNSLLEGEISDAQLLEIKTEIKNIIDESQDSVIIYTFENKNIIKRQFFGIKKGDPDQIIF